MPASITCDKLFCFGRSPGIRCVLQDRRYVSKDGVYDPPLFLDGILAHKERSLTTHGISEEPLIWRHLVTCLVGRDKLNFFDVRDDLSGPVPAVRTESELEQTKPSHGRE